MRCEQACGLNSLVDCFNVKTYDVWEGNVTTRRGIQKEHICSLGFPGITEGVTLRRVTLHRLGCIYTKDYYGHIVGGPGINIHLFELGPYH